MRNFHNPGRSAIHATNGVVSSSHPLATQAGLEILKEGGNAIDAAIATCAVQCVVEPQSTGIGGDCFAIIAPQGSSDLVAFNGSGKAPAGITVEKGRATDGDSLGHQSPHSITVPGAIDGWAQLLKDHGTMGFDRVLRSAIDYAENGYVVHGRVAFDWAGMVDILSNTKNASDVYLKDGRSYQEGEIHKQPALGKTLRAIAEGGRDAFYKGDIAEDMVSYLQGIGGVHTMDDFADAVGEYVETIRTDYRGYTLHEIPPNGHGMVALEMLNILDGFDDKDKDPLSFERLHHQIEAARIGYGDRDRFTADPKFADVPLDRLLSKEYAAEQRARISDEKALGPQYDDVMDTNADTVYITVVDKDRNAVSFINSIFHPFGSGHVTDTGVLLHNRGMSFRLDDSHPNKIEGGKRPMHTIIPAMVTKDDKAQMCFGVMGGHYQPQGQAHVLTNMLDYGMDMQTALDTPRVFADPDGPVDVEQGIPEDVVAKLEAVGNTINRIKTPHGGGQGIWINWESGVLTGGSEPRKDGCAIGY